VVEPGETVAAALRRALPDRSWSQIKKLCAQGKVIGSGQPITDPAARFQQPTKASLQMRRPRPGARDGAAHIVFEDAHLIIIDKPQGVPSVPYERKDRGTALDLIRKAWKLQHRKATQNPLYTVHRLDKDTSGLLCFAKTKLAERGLHAVFKGHQARRLYRAVVHGVCRPQTIESHLLADRGDGIRGSTRHPGQGKHSVTHVLETEPLGDSRNWPPHQAPTLCTLRLETGRTHQIRIHMAERGHPLIGETVYIRDFYRRDLEPVPCPRLLLHAATLGFTHPVSGAALDFTAPLPPDFEQPLQRLKAGQSGAGQEPATNPKASAASKPTKPARSANSKTRTPRSPARDQRPQIQSPQQRARRQGSKPS